MADAAIGTLTDFLLARITEDGRRRMAYWHDIECDMALSVDKACTCGSQARVAAECAAKRRIVAAASGWDDAEPDARYCMNRIKALLALPYADHPDYREEWKP